MSILDQQIRKLTEQISAVMADLVSKNAGIPRPIIALNDDMPFVLPVHQRAVAALKRIAQDNKQEFAEPELTFLVYPFDEPASRRTVVIKYPYTELTGGDVIDRLDDRSEVQLVTITLKGVPKEWRSPRAIDLHIQARSPSRRYGEALAPAPRINLRVPRWAIEGKETGI